MSKKEAEERVEKMKKQLVDYQRIAKIIEIDRKTRDITIDMFLDDLSQALEESRKYKPVNN